MAALQSPPALSSGAFVFTPYEVPGAYQVFDLGHINDLGQIVGDYRQNTGYFRRFGFVLNPGGGLAPIDIVGFGSAGLRYPQFVAQFATAGINNAGTAVGSYVVYTIDFSQPYGGAFAVAAHGFIRDAAGHLTTLDVPGSTFTAATGINDAGQIVGTYSPDGPPHGFLRNPDGTVTLFDAPGAVNTIPTGVNNFGQTVGTYITSNIGPTHGFLRDPDGTMRTVDGPGVRFAPVALNDLGEIAGNSSRTTALLREPDGTFLPIVAPAAPLAPATNVSGINNLGQMAGRATLYPYDAHYFIAARPLAQGRLVPPIPLTPTRPFAPGLPDSIAHAKMAACTWLQEDVDSIASAMLVPTFGGLVLRAGHPLVPPPVRVVGSLMGFFLQATVGVATFAAIETCIDPFDPNYATVFTPQFHPLPPIPAGNGISPDVADTATIAMTHLGRAASYLQAVDVTINRYISALQSHDDVSAALQQEALTRYERLGSEELLTYGREIRRLARLIRPTSLNVEITTGEIETFSRQVRTQGINALPAVERGIFNMFGMSPSDALLSQLAGVEPSRMAHSMSEALLVNARIADRLAHRLEPRR